MANQTFDFKQFSIHQDRCAMKVGTDGVLLGAWAGQGMMPQSVLDIGTGTGIVALMLAQRFGTNELHVDAVEIDPDAAAQARENADASPWGERITVVPESLAQAAERLLDARYDLIVSNPPFYNATLKPDDQGRALARHKDALPVAEITRFAHSHLNTGGRLALIYPTDYDTEVMTAAVLEGLAPTRLCDILTKVGKPCKRRMAEFAPGGGRPVRETLAIRDAEGHYTEPYRRLTEAFYLHLSD